jgi:hypothetical protein
MRRSGTSRRIAHGKYWNHPGGSMAFQDSCLVANAEWKLTDTQLGLLYTANYEDTPCVPVTVALVGVIRRLFNEGRHSKECPTPTVPSVPYTDTDYVPVPDPTDDPDARRD